jgi:hypothetical protein
MFGSGILIHSKSLQQQHDQQKKENIIIRIAAIQSQDQFGIQIAQLNHGNKNLENYSNSMRNQ